MSTFNPTVTYLPVKGFPAYKVGNDGSVWSCYNRGSHRVDPNKWRKLKPSPMKHGHMRVFLCPGAVCHLVHRLVLEAFVGPCPPNMEACHEDGNPRNNLVTNLRWDTHAGNLSDTAKHGTRVQGEKVHCSVLTEDQIRGIRRKYATGKYSQQKLADETNTTQGNIGQIVRRLTWKHVK